MNKINKTFTVCIVLMLLISFQFNQCYASWFSNFVENQVIDDWCNIDPSKPTNVKQVVGATPDGMSYYNKIEINDKLIALDKKGGLNYIDHYGSEIIYTVNDYREISLTSSDWYLIQEIKLNKTPDLALRISWWNDTYNCDSSSYLVYSMICRATTEGDQNNPQGRRVCASVYSSWRDQWFTEDIPGWHDGDIIQLWMKAWIADGYKNASCAKSVSCGYLTILGKTNIEGRNVHDAPLSSSLNKPTGQTIPSWQVQ